MFLVDGGNRCREDVQHDRIDCDISLQNIDKGRKSRVQAIFCRFALLKKRQVKNIFNVSALVAKVHNFQKVGKCGGRKVWHPTLFC